MSECKWCKVNFNLVDKPKGWIANHTRWCTKNPNLNNYKEKLKKTRSYIDYTKVSNSLKNTWRNGKYDNVNYPKTRKPLTESHKLKISKALKEAHNRGQHTGWKHINSNVLRMSRPEKTFQRMLNESRLFDNYHIEYGFSISKYFLDFAILDLKLDIEIDGVQHIRNNSNIEHDKIRDAFLLNQGWIVYRISVKELSDENLIQKLFQFIEDNEKYRKYDPIEILNKYNSKKSIYGSMRDYNEAIRFQNNQRVQPIIEELINSNINFDKFGWVNHAAKIIGISPQKVKGWMIRYIPEFYEKTCYKRK